MLEIKLFKLALVQTETVAGPLSPSSRAALLRIRCSLPGWLRVI